MLCMTAAMACGENKILGPDDYDAWVAEIQSLQYVVAINIATKVSPVRGGGTLTPLLNAAGGEGLTVSGTRIADTLDLSLAATSGMRYDLRVWYVSNGRGLTGRINGGVFNNVSLSFRPY